MKIIRFSFKFYWSLFPIVWSSLKLRITVRGGIVDALVSMKHQIICNHDDDSVVTSIIGTIYDDVIKWKHFRRYWPFVREIHRSPVNSPHKGHWRGALTFSLICVWINGWVNNREAGDLRRYRAHYDVSVMITFQVTAIKKTTFERGRHVVGLWLAGSSYHSDNAQCQWHLKCLRWGLLSQWLSNPTWGPPNITTLRREQLISKICT